MTNTVNNVGVISLAGDADAFYGTIARPFSLTASRTWTFPNATGTVALTSDIPNMTTYTGSTSITTLGTITTGTVPIANTSGTVPVNRGGTGLTALGTGLQVLRVNSGATGLEYVTPPWLTSFTEADPVWTGVSGNYYTKTNLQTSGQAAVHWGNLSNVPYASAGTGGVVKVGSGLAIDVNGVLSTSGTTGLTNAYTGMTDGTTTTTTTAATTFKFRSANNLLTPTVTDNDPTHGDNLLLTVNQANIQLAESQVTNLTTDLAAKQAQLNGTGLVRQSGTTTSYDNSTYLTANQNITLSGDVSGSGTTAITTSIGANKVTLAQMAQVATGTFLGRTTAATGNVEAMTTAQAKTLLGLTGTNSGDQTITLSGDISGTGTGAITATLPTVNANVGTWNNVTVNGKGLVTAGSNVGYTTLSSALTGYAVGSNTALAATDNILGAFGKVQGQLNAKVGGGGTAGQLPFWNTSSTLSGSANATLDANGNMIVQKASVNRLGYLDGSMSMRFNRQAGNYIEHFFNNDSSRNLSFTTVGNNVYIQGLNDSGTPWADMIFSNYSSNGTGGHLTFNTPGGNMRWTSTGKLLVGTTTDNGFDMVQVNGSTTTNSLNVVSNLASLQSPAWIRYQSNVAGESGTDNGQSLAIASSTASTRPVFLGQRSRGTLAAPTTTQNGDWLMGIVAAGFDAANARQTGAAIEFKQDGAATTGGVPISISLQTGTAGGNRSDALTLGSDKSVTAPILAGSLNRVVLATPTGKFLPLGSGTNGQVITQTASGPTWAAPTGAASSNGVVQNTIYSGYDTLLKFPNDTTIQAKALNIAAGANITVTKQVTDTTIQYTIAGTAGGSSYTFGGSLVNTSGTVTLKNDNAAPGNNYVYGTSSAGTPGWQAGTVIDMTGFVANDYVKYDGTKFVRGTPSGGGGSGTVTSASVVSANGFAGTVATATTTPAITLTTSVASGSIIKSSSGALAAAVAGTDYEAGLGNPAASGSVLTSTTGGVRTWQAGTTIDMTGMIANDLTKFDGTKFVRLDGGIVPLKNTVNSYSAKQTFNSTATTAGMNLAGGITAAPSSLTAGDIWYNSTAPGNIQYADGSLTTRTIVTTDATQTLSNKTFSGVTSANWITVTGGVQEFSETGSTSAAPASSLRVYAHTTDRLKTINSAGTVQDMAYVTDNVAGSLLAVRYLTTGTSYTPTTGTTKIVLEMLGGGGGGGGVTGAASSGAAGGGGGAGGYLQKYVTGITNTTYTYAIGAAGTAGANTGGTGGTGGNTTITIGATTYSAFGGGGGAGMTAGTALSFSTGGTQGTATNGDVNASGDPGLQGVRLAATTVAAGNGGSSRYGGGGKGSVNTTGAGVAGTGYGAGGAGAIAASNVANVGGLGTQGIIIIYEYK
jgi:hypothetical protein